MPNNCTYNGIYASLKHCKGKTILPGLRSRLYFIPKAHIVTWPKLRKIEGQTVSMYSVYEGSFVLAADKKWMYIDVIDNKGKLESESQGEKPARTFLNKLAVIHPETDELASSFCRQANADDFVYLVQVRNGKFRVLGNEMFETDTKPKQDSGEGVSGDFGTTIEIEVTDECPAPFYYGTIELADGDIELDPATGEIVTNG